MKLNNNFLLKEIAGDWILVPFGQNALDFNGVITLNETAKFLYENCDESIESDKLKSLLIDKYNVDENIAENAIELFIEQLKEAGCIDE